jgi:hypothetical protein
LDLRHYIQEESPVPEARALLAALSLRYPTTVGRNFAVHSLRLYAARDAALSGRLTQGWLDLEHTTAADELAAAMLAQGPDLIALSCYVWSTPLLLEAVALAKAERPEVAIVLGGPDAAPRAELLLARHPFVDAVCLGEGEQAWLLLLRRWLGVDPGEWRTSPGWLGRVGGEFGPSAAASSTRGPEFVRGPEAPPVEMDSLPSFLDEPGLVERHGGLAIQGARGCRFRCAYCQYNATPRRPRSLALVQGEIDRFAALGGGSVSILDAGINQDRGRFRAVLERIAGQPSLSLSSPEVNVEELADDEIELLTRVTSTLAIGLQTTNRSTARAIRRAYRPTRFRERLALLRERGVRFTLDVIYGLPGDDLERFRKTLDDAYALEPDVVLPFQLQVLPGSTLAREAERFGLRYDPEPPYHISSSASWSAEELDRARRLADANDLMHTFTFSSRGFQAAARALGVRPSAWIEEFLAGGWRDDGAVTEEELATWSGGELGALLGALGSWLEASFRERGRELEGEVQDALARQFVHAILLARDVAAPETPPAWPPAAGSRPTLAPCASVLALHAPAAAGAYELLLRGADGELEARALAPRLGRLLSAADGEHSLEELLAELPAEVDAAPLLEELRVLTARGAVGWAARC